MAVTVRLKDRDGAMVEYPNVSSILVPSSNYMTEFKIPNNQKKSVRITANGGLEVTPDEDCSGLSSVSIDVAVPASANGDYNAFVKSWKLGAQKAIYYDIGGYFDPTNKNYYSSAGLGGLRALSIAYGSVNALLPLTETAAATEEGTYNLTFMQQAEGAASYQNYAEISLYAAGGYGTAAVETVVLNGADVTAAATAGDIRLLAYVSDAVLTTIDGVDVVMVAYDDPACAQWAWENNAVDGYSTQQSTENNNYFEGRTATLRFENKNSAPVQLAFTWSTVYEPSSRPGETKVGDTTADSGTFSGVLEAGGFVSVAVASPPTGHYTISSAFPSSHIVISGIAVTQQAAET